MTQPYDPSRDNDCYGDRVTVGCIVRPSDKHGDTGMGQVLAVYAGMALYRLLWDDGKSITHQAMAHNCQDLEVCDEDQFALPDWAERVRLVDDTDGPLDMNGVPVRVGDLICTDCDEIGRVRDIAGTYDAGVTFDLLLESYRMGLPDARDGGAWQCGQVAVFLRADGSRPVVPQPVINAPPATGTTPDVADESEPADAPDESREVPEVNEPAAGSWRDAIGALCTEPPAQARDKHGRVLVPGDIALDEGNDIIVRIAVTYGADIIGDRLFTDGKRDEGTWSTAACEMVWLGHDTSTAKAVA